MVFKVGDLVIKKDGGNKMVVFEVKEDKFISCIWATDGIHNQSFNSDDLMPLSDWRTMMNQFEREDKILQIIGTSRNNP